MPTLIILLVMFVAILGPAAVIVVIGLATIKGLGRNPSAASKMFLGMIIMIIFACVISVVALLILFQLFGK